MNRAGQATQQLYGGRPADATSSTGSSTPPTEDQAPTSGASLHEFILHEKLGAGGNATVHLATWKPTGEKVALKIIHGELAADPKYLERFRREVRAASQLKHPNICNVFAWGETDGKLFMAMEVIQGGTLRDLIERAEGLPPQVAAVVMTQLLSALGVAHDAGILHRDIKPANAMVTKDGVLKLVDFGIAKGQDDATVTETGFLVGTPAYMSPEQAVGRDIDARSDLYAAGVCLFEMLIGENPYANDAPSQALLRIASEAIPSVFELDPTVPGVVEGVFERLVERDLAARYASGREAVNDLRPYLTFVDELHPELLRQFVADPQTTKELLRQEQAELEVARAERLLLAGEVNLPAAALALFRAQLLQNTVEVAHRFDHVCARGGFRFGQPDDDALLTARTAVTQSPNPAGPLKRLADLYRARGDIHLAVVFLRRYLREKPSDSHAQHQLELCVAGVPSPMLGPEGKLQTRDILAGGKTGGWASVAPARKELALSLQQPKPGVRSKAGREPARQLPTETSVVRRPLGDEPTVAKLRVAAAARQRRAPVGPAGARSGDDDLQSVIASFWERFGRRLFVASIFLGGFAVIVWLFSTVINGSIGATQRALSDNTVAVGDIERNDAARVQDNLMNDAIAAENNGDWNDAVTAVNRLLATRPAATLGLNALLIRARCRLQLNDRESARRDFNEFMQQTPLTDPRRVAIKAQLDELK